MINLKQQPLWINFYNLDAENLAEITVLYCRAFLPIRVARRSGDEEVLAPKQQLIKEYQSEFRKVVNRWLDEIKPRLMNQKLSTVMVDDFIQWERDIISPFLKELNSMLSGKVELALLIDKNLGRVYLGEKRTSKNEIWWIGKCFREFANAIITDTPVLRCAAGETPKTPACQNIFIPQRKGAKYCSDRCKNRITQAKRNAEMKEILGGIHKRGRKENS